MISPESFVFSPLAKLLRATYPGAMVYGEKPKSPAQFPVITIVETDNSVLQKMSTINIENAAVLLYEVNVYSNKTSGKKQECKDIMETIDDEFARMNFTRTMCNPVENLEDSTIYRMVARYTGVADKDFMIYTK